MAVSNAGALACPRCGNSDRVYQASSYPERFALFQQNRAVTPSIPFGMLMLAGMLATVPFLAGSGYARLTDWPSTPSLVHGLLPKPLLLVAAGLVVLLVVVDRSTRPFLRSWGRAVALDSRLYGELDLRNPAFAPQAIAVGIACLGWGVFLSTKSAEWWLAAARARDFAGPDLAPLATQGFLAGALVSLAGLPVMAFVMAWMARTFADYAFFSRGEASARDFARNLAYPYTLLPLAMGLAASGLQPVFALATCWFLAAAFVAARHTVKQSTELALPVLFLGAAPVILTFFFVTLQVQKGVVNSNWGSFRGRTATIPDLEIWWLMGVLTVCTLLTLAAFLAAASTRRKNARSRSFWRQAVHPGSRLLCCERCGGVHLPNQRDFVPASEIGKLLPERGPDE
ncbi:MAG TPA: hypothetical protein VF960_13690 [Chloroflexota bacterium]